MFDSQKFDAFSHRSRDEAIQRFGTEVFDLLVIGGGISGASVARDAVSRGLKVALVEKRDFAWGTSSRSSKLIHGGLRYLENFEFALVFEALAERALLLKTAPTMVRPLKFYFPVFKGDSHGKTILGLGMWLYDLLALFRTPGFHRSLSAKKFSEEIPFIKQDGLTGGFQYYDASMWDDVLGVQTLRSAHAMGAAIASYVEAITPLYGEDGMGPVGEGRITGFKVRDREKPEGKGEVNLFARQVVVCAGPWTDKVGTLLSPAWRKWLSPSKGVHLVFDLKRIPIAGAMVMTHPEDGRISFVIPRPDYGAGVTIVGTTDGPSPEKPEESSIDMEDVKYLLDLLNRYFPELKLRSSDILSGYVGVRPLMAPNAPGEGGTLQKVSREHHIGDGPGGTVVIAGGKYTTSRKMGEEIVDYALKSWRRAYAEKKTPHAVPLCGPSKTKEPVNPMATPEMLESTKKTLPQTAHELVERFGAETHSILALAKEFPKSIAENTPPAPPGFTDLAAQLRHAMRTEMVMHLEDFYLRRVPLYLSREDHGLPWAFELSRIWAEERGLSSAEADRELEQLKTEIDRRSAWKKGLFEPLKEDTSQSNFSSQTPLR
jgi:glycerol-3-phosphate dehydrogenase